MAPKGVNWRRPHTSIYNDNYRYGENLYSGTLSDIQKKTTKPQVVFERPDYSLPTFTSSSLSSSAPVASSVTHTANPLSPTPTVDLSSSSFHGSVFESMLNSALHSSYAIDAGDDKVLDRRPASRSTDVTMTTTRTSEVTKPMNRTPEPTKPASQTDDPPRPTSLYDDAGLFTSMKKKTNETTESESSSVRRKKVIKDLPSPVVPSAQNGPSNPNFWKDQCRDLQGQVDVLTQAMADMSGKLKGELSTMKSKLHSEINDLHSSLEHSSQQSNDLQKVVKKQSNQLMELQTSYEDLQRHFQDSLDEVNGWQKRHQTLRKEMDRLRADVEETLQKSSSATTVRA